jgi:hypothetical protein
LSEQNHKHRWAIILAGETLLEQVQRRVALLLNPTQAFTVVTHTQKPFSSRAVERLVKGSSARLLGIESHNGEVNYML